MVCGGQTSRFEVAQELLNILGLKDKVRLNAVDSSYFAEEYFAPRPPSERLVNRKLSLRGINLMRDWRVALQEYLSEYYAGYLG
jgi:dTDP-4-dehydrorhamnose reductase